MTDPAAPRPAAAPAAGAGLPVLGEAVFWRAEHLGDTPFLWHLPLLFWLIEVQRPQLCVTLGPGEGTGFMAICQALERLCPGARAHAAGGWEPGLIPEALLRAAEPHAARAQLLDGDAAAAAGLFAPGSVDLLLLDLTAAGTEAGAADLLAAWGPKLSGRAVLLLHGRDSDRAPSAEIQPGPGIAEIRFGTTEGLRLWLWGADQPAALRHLAAGPPGDGALRAAFSRLGAAQHFEWTARQMAEGAREMAALKDSLAARYRELAVLVRELEARGGAAAPPDPDLAPLKAELLAWQQRCAAIEASSSWRLTAPIRALMGLLRRGPPAP